MRRPALDIFFLRRRAEETASDLPGLMSRAEKAAASIMMGEHAQRKTGPGERFRQFREYRPGDRPQDIDWRQSAKTDAVFIRQKELQTPQPTLFWCARGAGMDFRSEDGLPSKSEATRVLSLALALLITRAGDRAGLMAGGRAGRSENALEGLARGLLEDGTDALPDYASAACPADASVILAGDFMSPQDSVAASLENFFLHHRNGLLLQVLDPAEIELPYAGRAIFHDPRNGRRELVNHVDSIRSGYRTRITAHMEFIKTLCHSYGWQYILHRTDQPESQALAAAWESLHRHNSAGART